MVLIFLVCGLMLFLLGALCREIYEYTRSEHERNQKEFDKDSDAFKILKDKGWGQ